MRPATVALLIVAISLTTGACKRRERAKVETIEEPFALKSTVATSDPRAAVQLVNGFYDIEFNAWRWTAGKFAVNLRPPRGSAESGAKLVLRFSAPEPVMSRLNTIKLSAKVGSTDVGSETYSKPGETIFRKDVPASALSGDSVVVSFELDKSLPAGSVDQRELGVIVSSIALEK
jgi:hypothetical protein